MFSDVSRNLLVMAVFILAFSSGLTALHDDDFNLLEDSLVALLRKGISFHPPNTVDMHPLSQIFLFSFAVISIGLTAILIAQIRSSYS